MQIAASLDRAVCGNVEKPPKRFIMTKSDHYLNGRDQGCLTLMHYPRCANENGKKYFFLSFLYFFFPLYLSFLFVIL